MILSLKIKCILTHFVSVATVFENSDSSILVPKTSQRTSFTSIFKIIDSFADVHVPKRRPTESIKEASYCVFALEKNFLATAHQTAT